MGQTLTIAVKKPEEVGLAGAPGDVFLHPRHRQVPEGGSGLVYLLAAGITCAGAMLTRSRETKPKQT